MGLEMINFLIGVLSVVSFMTIYVWFKETNDKEYLYKTAKRKMKDKNAKQKCKIKKAKKTTIK